MTAPAERLTIRTVVGRFLGSTPSAEQLGGSGVSWSAPEDLADLVRPAEIVTLDRVINVCPGWERPAGLAAARAKRLVSLVYPRDTRLVRLISP